MRSRDPPVEPWRATIPAGETIFGLRASSESRHPRKAAGLADLLQPNPDETATSGYAKAPVLTDRGLCMLAPHVDH